MDDPEDAFEDSLLTLFAHHPVAFSTPGPEVPYIYQPPGPGQDAHPLSLLLPIAPAALHTALQLTHIWLSSVLLADLVYTREIDVRGRTVAELGAGAGLPGIAAVRGGAAYVVGTDYDVRAEEGKGDGIRKNRDIALPPREKDVLDILRDNYLAATRDSPGAEEGRAWSVMGHTWATPVDPLLRVLPVDAGAGHPHEATPTPRFQTLLLADLLWSSSSHSALITSIRALLASSAPPATSPLSHAHAHAPASAHLAAGLHHGRHAVRRFQAEWIARGGWVRSRREVRWVWAERARGESSWEVLRRGGGAGEGKEAEGENEDEDEDDPERDRGVVVWFEIGLEDGGET